MAQTITTLGAGDAMPDASFLLAQREYDRECGVSPDPENLECAECGFTFPVLKPYVDPRDGFTIATCATCHDIFAYDESGRGSGHRLIENPTGAHGECDHGQHAAPVLHMLGDGHNDFLAFCPEHCALNGCARSGKES